MSRRAMYAFNSVITVFLVAAWLGAIWPSPRVFAAGAGLAALVWIVKGAVEYGRMETAARAYHPVNTVITHRPSVGYTVIEGGKRPAWRDADSRAARGVE
jgi:hypothetical protein